MYFSWGGDEELWGKHIPEWNVFFSFPSMGIIGVCDICRFKDGKVSIMKRKVPGAINDTTGKTVIEKGSSRTRVNVFQT